MQGRLSPLVDGRIQAFPECYWRAEFPAAAALGLRLMEWTLDHDRLAANPLMTPEGQAEIRDLSARYGVAIPSLTGDCFMQAPFWKAAPAERPALEAEFHSVLEASAAMGIGMVVVPLVDNGRLEERAQQDRLVAFLNDRVAWLAARNLRVAWIFTNSGYQ